MADAHSNAPSNPNSVELLAINESFRAENLKMAELLRQKQNSQSKGGEHKNAENKDDNDEHTSEAKHTIPTPLKTVTKITNPFTKEAMSFQMFKNFTLSMTLKPYVGIGDPNIHVTKLYIMMFMNKESTLILCRTFPTFLDGAALIWFSNLLESSISNFNELADQFVNHFAASKIYVHNSDYLSTINQGTHENLKDYMTRFAEATNEIPNLNPEDHLHALKSSLRPGKFQETIVIAKPKILTEFREKFDNYTPLNGKKEDIIKDILHSKLIKPPNKAGTCQDQRYIDKSKYCTFHQKYGHTTDDYVIAKDLLEKLARQGLLDKYIDTRGRKRHTEDLSQHSKIIDNPRDKGIKVDEDVNPPRRVINCISGGFAGGGCTNSARKRSYRAMTSVTGSTSSQPINPHKSEISFLPKDYKVINHNLDDPVVISSQVGEPLVKKILMDPRSSADVLFYSTFQKMKLSDKALQPSSGKLVGFSSEQVPIRGYIWLQTTLGNYPDCNTIDIQYLVVDCKSP
ncbi:uncharacterized protein LOC107632606 [Arachis ipaensis]|uniref:uncharacterized protein LOC107632606 n=1 Tax=Arachis ipaensis TaxID=130454 RepID=UPI0007AF63E1|nr:uncharacterized protein LOC107632606 [Arachis ipaensis]